MTEIYDYLRVLFARVGTPYCLACGRKISKLSNEEIVDRVVSEVSGMLATPPQKKVMGVPVENRAVRIFAPIVVGRKGEYYQLLYDLLGRGYEVVRIDGVVKKLRERIELAKHKQHNIDALVDEILIDEFKTHAEGSRMRLSEAIERAIHETNGLVRVVTPDDERLVSTKFMCPYDGFSYPEIEPRLFSFNSPHGACLSCNGLGTKHFFGDEPCEACRGARLRDEALHVRLSSGADTEEGLNIVELTAKSIIDSRAFFKKLPLDKKEKEIAKVVIKEIESRLSFMDDVGIGYLSLERRANTLSGGEAQRIRLASQLGSQLVGALYVLDEPTIGLHSRDTNKMIETLHKLRDLGNTIIVVEHDEGVALESDYLVDIGPGAGIHGGEIVAAGDVATLVFGKKKHDSLTVRYLRGDISIETPSARRNRDAGTLKVRGGKVFNIKNMNADIPLRRLVAVTGVSGSGKSSFVYEILYKNLQARFERRYRSNQVFNCDSMSGTEHLSRVLMIDQSPIGRTPRSNPATYTGMFTFIRELFAQTEEARVRGYKPSRFSFNVKGGRCEACEGNGMLAVEMHFLPTVYVTCDVCNGKRFQKDTLEVKYKKKSIYDVLTMTAEVALEFFRDIPTVYDRLKTVNEVGLGYLELGQSATTLSGGEAQRIKIASELYRPYLTKTLYILDEPTVGLHYEDVRKLIEILHRLVDEGNTVIAIEHNMDVIKNADYVIDIGPEGGDGGGEIVAKGTPEQVAQNAKSMTGKYLKKALQQK